MKIEELKQAVNTGTLPSTFLILVCDGNYFLADQYIETLCQKTNKEKNKISSIYDLNSSLSLVIDYSQMVNVLKVDTFSEKATDYSGFDNIIVICDKVDKKLEKLVAPYVVKMPKLLDWQIKAYIKAVCPGLDETAIEWLYTATKGDIYRIQLELSKIKLFKQDEQLAIFRELARDQLKDLYSIDIYTLKNELVKPGISSVVREFMENVQYAPNIGAFGLIAMLLNDFKKALFITQNSGMSTEDLVAMGMTTKQIYAIKNSYSKLYSGDRLGAYLKKNIEFLSSINSRLVQGQLELTEPQLLNYIICNILS